MEGIRYKGTDAENIQTHREKWLKKAGEALDAEVAMRKQNEPARKIEILEMDELYTFVRNNPAKSAYGLLLTETGAKLLQRMH